MVSDNLILTKLYISRSLASLVRRPRLFRSLDEEHRGKLTTVSAPPGFGKTTLLSDWTRQREQPASKWPRCESY